MLLIIFGSCSVAVKRQLFMAYCGSFYTSNLWCNYTQQQINKLKVAYNNIFRKLMYYDRYCSASDMFVTNRVSNYVTCIRRTIYSFRERIYNSENVIISSIVKSTEWGKSPLLIRWNTYLYNM